jgi:hypothetical protein
MSKYGKPMYEASQHAYTFVTIDEGGAHKLVRFRGRSCKTNQRAAKKKYPNAKLRFGRCIWITD